MTAMKPKTKRDAASFTEVIRGGLMVIGPDKPRLVVSAALSFLVGLLETLLLYAVARVAVSMSGSHAAIRLGPASFGWDITVAQMTMVAGGLVIALILLTFPLSALLASLSSRAMVRMRTALLLSYLRASVAYRDTHREGYLQQLMGEYSQRGERAVQQLATFFTTMCALSVMIVGAIVATPLVAFGVILGLSLSSLIINFFTKKLRSGTQTLGTNREVIGRVAQTTRLSEEISSFHVAGAVADELSVGLRMAAASVNKIRYEGRLVPSLFQYGTLGIVLILIAILSIVAPDRLGGLAPLALLLIRALGYIRQIQRALQSARETTPYIKLLFEERETLEANRAPSGEVTLDRFTGLQFDHVCYEYKPGEPVLKDVTFNVEPGQMVGIVGPSGSGKSTLSGLMLRLREPTSGSVTAGGVPLVDVTAESWSRLSAFVPQDSRLIYATVADNIRFFREGFSLDQVIRAAKAAHLYDEMIDLPEQFETLIGPGARGLSGGQRQRLAIARALLADPQLIIMDEPTSALDAKSELLVSQTLDELKGKATIILIAHRPATLTICDRILRVTKGVLTEEQAELAGAH